MLQLLALMLVYGVVVNASTTTGVFLNDENGKLVNPMPSNELLTDALKKGGNLLGIGYSTDFKTHPYFVEKFETNYSSTILEYNVKYDLSGTPVVVAVYVSKDGKNWEIVKEDVASIGWHRIAIPKKVGSSFYVKFEVLKSAKGFLGASLIDEMYVTEGFLSPLDKFDFGSMSVMLAGYWLPFTWLPILFLACLVGASLKKNSLLPALIAFLLPFTLDIVFGLDLYFLNFLFRTPYSLVASSIILGMIFSFFASLLSDVLDKRSNNTYN